MKNDLHLVCPHCQSINRVPTAKLSEHPNCGRCQQPLFTGETHRVDHGDVLAPRGAQRPAAAGRFLGALVRAVQDDGPAVPASGAPARNPGSGWPRSIPRQNPTWPRSSASAAFRRSPCSRVAGDRRQAGALGAQDIVRWASAHSGR